MIETFFGSGTIGSPQAFVAALVIGLFFGFALERAGFGSSRRLAGIFYFRDMAVLKVMFTALITAMLGLSYLIALGWIEPGQLYFMPAVYGAQVVGGVLFGVGFVMSGWCPGTGAVGLASGKLDALLFLLGAVLGSVLFNELFPLVKSLYSWGESGVRFVYNALGMSLAAFAFLFTLMAVGCFWGAEYIEKKKSTGGACFNTPFLKAFSLALLIFAGGLFIFPTSQLDLASEGRPSPHSRAAAVAEMEKGLLQLVQEAGDHMEPAELADRLMNGEPGLVVLDIRTPDEYNRFHIRGAVNVPITQLDEYLRSLPDRGITVLYSNGMTHPAQARDALFRMGHQNLYILTDGLTGFMETCLKPASLRTEPVPEDFARKIRAWRNFFYASAARESTVPAQGGVISPFERTLPWLVETDWLSGQLGREDLKILDVRSQPEYNSSHIPGAIYVSVESFRGVVRGVPSMLLPSEMLALHLSQMGIHPQDRVIIVPGDKIQDATLVGMAFQRLGHQNYAVLNGGFDKWASENRPVDAALPPIVESRYPVGNGVDDFTVDYLKVHDFVKNGGAVILDVRPADYYAAKKSDEARAGHIPGAINRPFSEDVLKTDKYSRLKSREELATAYAALIPSRDSTVIVHCRTGHQASQTYFVLKHLLGYPNVLWYDAGWTEWAARPELPVDTGAGDAK